MHSALVAGWSGVMGLYELILLDTSDAVYNPMWRQGCYVLPFISRLGVVSSIYNWNIGIISSTAMQWSYELVIIAHLVLSGLLIGAAFWHWCYWDLDVFLSSRSGKLVIDLNRVFGIHLALASMLCTGFGLCHLTGYIGPGFWTSDSVGLLGSIRYIKPTYSIIGLTPYCYGVISSHHISAGVLGLIVSLWHISTRPGPSIYSLLVMGSLEGVLSSSIIAVYFAGIISSSLMWFGSLTTGLELYGPTRYQWDNGYFTLNIEARVNSMDRLLTLASWEQIPDKLIFYDYLGNNPAKGGLFRSGGQIKGDGIVQCWLGHASFELGSLEVSVRRMPAFFETFPVVLIDKGGTVRADIPFRRAESLYSLEQTQVSLQFSGGILSGSEYQTASLVKSYARKAQFGQMLAFDRKTSAADGVFRTSLRGWFTFGHACLAFLFWFGHLWHGGRSLFKAIWTGVTTSSELLAGVEYGRNEKLGERTTKSSAFI